MKTDPSALPSELLIEQLRSIAGLDVLRNFWDARAKIAHAADIIARLTADNAAKDREREQMRRVYMEECEFLRAEAVTILMRAETAEAANAALAKDSARWRHLICEPTPASAEVVPYELYLVRPVVAPGPGVVGLYHLRDHDDTGRMPKFFHESAIQVLTTELVEANRDYQRTFAAHVSESRRADFAESELAAAQERIAALESANAAMRERTHCVIEAARRVLDGRYPTCAGCESEVRLYDAIINYDAATLREHP